MLVRIRRNSERFMALPQLNRPVLAVLFLGLGAVLTTVASFVFGVPWLMLVLGAAVPFPIFLGAMRQTRYNLAFGLMLVWGFFQSCAVAIASLIAPTRAAAVVLSGAGYRDEMLHWIRTGEGAEGTLRLFLPIHLLHYGIFCLLSLLTFGGAALLLGTWLLNYMNFYVGELVRLSANPWIAAIIAWPPWSLLRVVGYIATGVALTAVALRWVAKVRGKTPLPPLSHRYLLVGVGFVVADLAVKAVLAPAWQQLLRNALLAE